MNLRNIVLWIFLFSISNASSKAFAEKDLSLGVSKPPAKVSTPSVKMIWNWFQLGGGAMFDSDGGSSGITGLNWNPTLRLDDIWRLKFSLGGSVGNLGTGSPFFIGEGLLSLIYVTRTPFWFEGGGGYQYWDGRSDFHPQLRAGIGYRLWGEGNGILDNVHTLHVSYTYAPLKLVKVHQAIVSILFRI